jgi:hypothetical protein
VLTEPADKLPVTYRFHRGDPKQPKEAIPPGALSVLAPRGEPSHLPKRIPTSRRADAGWLSRAGSPAARTRSSRACS